MNSAFVGYRMDDVDSLDVHVLQHRLHGHVALPKLAAQVTIVGILGKEQRAPGPLGLQVALQLILVVTDVSVGVDDE